MKSILFVFCFIWCQVWVSGIQAQEYNSVETAKLYAFLIQESAEPGIKNYQQLGIKDIDHVSWGSVDGLMWNAQYHMLERVYWSDKKLSGNMDFSNFSVLKYLYCDWNKIKSVDVTNAPLLSQFDFYENELSHVDLTTNPRVSYVRLGFNNLKTLILSDNPELSFLCCTSNQVEQLDLSNKRKLKTVYCLENNLTSLKVDNCVSLATLRCSFNKLSTLDLYNVSEIEELSCHYNNLTELKNINSKTLTDVFCYNNNLEVLDFSLCEKLSLLNCGYNNLKELNIKNCNNLETLYCEKNQLDSLILPDSPSLSTLQCNNNNLNFLSLPPITENLTSYSYYPQNDLAFEYRYDSIDLSGFYSIQGNLSRYTWRYKYSLVPPLQNENGVFAFDQSYVGAVFECFIQNTTLPKLALHYDITLKSAEDVGNMNPVRISDQVYGKEGHICVKTQSAATVRIYSLNGVLVCSEKIGEGQTEIPVNRGIYLVSLNNNPAYKVSVR